jgi:tetratricopeptide (TPR) repeat protein
MLDDSRIDSGGHMNVSGMVEDGIRLARRGQRAEAEAIFRRLIQIAPENEDGWLWMAWLADSREESLRYLREGLRFSPDGPSLREGVAWVEAHKPSAVVAETQKAAPSPASPAPSRAARRQAKLTRTGSAAGTPRGTAGGGIRAGAGASTSRKPSRSGSAHAGRARFDFAGLVEKFRSLSVTVISIVAVAILIGVVTLVARQAVSETPAVAAMVLPTPVLDATPTPGVENLSRPLWTRVEIAFQQEDWGAAITALDQIRSLDSQNVKARERLSAALYQRALDSIAKNELELAKRDLDRAVTLDADSPNLQSTRRDVELYRSAVESYLEQDWAKSVFLLTQVYERTPNFRDTRSMLGQAHCHLAEQQLTGDNLDEALAQATLCEQILQGDEDAAALVKQVTETIRPPRRIEVSLSDFRTRVYEDNEVIKSFPICYGRPSHPTKTGRFEVQTKMDNAYGSAWDLNMPYWLGIYWAGGTENGFHALPILSSGATLWAGSLGTRCSFGCIVLGTEEAKWLYDWSTLGTVVFVNP